MDKPNVAKRTLYELVAVPLALAALGYLLLRASDGSWWGVALWVFAAPIVYLLIDVFVFAPRHGAATRKQGRVTATPTANPSGTPRQAATPGKDTPRADAWSGVRRKSAGAEILRRGRRYDRRAG